MGILSKLKKYKAKDMFLYLEEEVNEYESYIETSLGKYDDVFHEIVSPDIHLDIIIIPPTDTHPFYKLVTMGMGAYMMNVPKDFREYQLEHAELVIYLPKDWDIQSSKEEDYWPIRYLKVLARLPLQGNTWLGYGHTIHGNQEMELFANNTNFNSFVLLHAYNLQDEQMSLELSSGKKINFYQLFPLYQEELDYKLENSLEDLLSQFNNKDLFPIVNNDRKNYGKKRE